MATTLKTIREQAEKRAGSVTVEVTERAQALGAEATRRAQDLTPVYAVVGLTDAVVERVRTAGESVASLGRTLHPQVLPGQLTKTAGEVSTQVEAAPAAALGEVSERVGKVQEGYQGLASRGEGLVGRIRTQQATKDLLAQVDSAVKQGRSLIATARRGVDDTQSAAKATVTTGRRQAAEATAEVIAGEPVTPTAPTGSPSRKASTPTSGTAKSGTAKSGTAKSGTAKSGTAKSGTAKSGTAKSGTAKSGTAKSGTAKSGTSQTSTPRSSTRTAKAGTAKSSTSRSTTAKSTTAKSTTAKSGTAKSTTAESTTAEAGARKPSTRSTGTAAKRTATTASNRVEETAAAARSAAGAATDAAEKAVDAATDSAGKVGD